ncbi:MAG: hypothetical protein H7317_04635 [Pseudorhodobacter sp.]|nr:hypothetical protein [Pseudorhodobacter sp.]
MKDKAKKIKKSKKRDIRALPAPERAHDRMLLETSRLQWQRGDWAELAAIQAATLTHHPDRARLALIVAAAHGQLGDTGLARAFAKAALDWGCSRAVVAQVLISSAHNGLARVATCLDDPSAPAHFTAALHLVEANGDVALLSRIRQVAETTRLGLWPEATALLAADIAKATAQPGDRAAELAMLDRQLADLQHRLAASRRPVFAGDDASDTARI